VLIWLLVMLIRHRRTISAEAMVWTLGISFLGATTARVPPTSREIITAFPAVMIAGHCIKGRRFVVLQCVNAALLILTTMLATVGHFIPP